MMQPTDTQADLMERARALVTEMQDACGIYHTSMIGRIAAFAAEARRAALEEAALLILDCNTLRGDKLADILATGIRALASPAPQEETR